jgi:hypothetical protein
LLKVQAGLQIVEGLEDEADLSARSQVSSYLATRETYRLRSENGRYILVIKAFWRSDKFLRIAVSV